MRAEVIIAARGELIDNLTRTLANVRATIGPQDDVRVILDGKHTGTMSLRDAKNETPWMQARGCGQARHYGITTSKARYVVMIDGHMQFPAGWLEEVCAHLSKHPRDITCTVNQSVSAKWEPFAEFDSGAHLHLHTEGPRVDPYGPAREFHGLSAKWRAGNNPGEVAAPMGACYGMRRAWYDKIGSPLQLLESWGCDEELLGVCGWLCGGRTVCLPLVTQHMYAAPHTDRIADPCGIWANRIATLKSIPGIGAETPLYVRQTSLPWGQIDARVNARADRIASLWAHILKQKRTFADMVAEGLVTVNPATITQTAPPPDRALRAMVQGCCRYCGPTARRNGRCAKCGSKAVV